MLRKIESLKKKGLVIKNTCKRGYALKEYNSSRSFQKNATQTMA